MLSLSGNAAVEVVEVVDVDNLVELVTDYGEDAVSNFPIPVREREISLQIEAMRSALGYSCDPFSQVHRAPLASAEGRPQTVAYRGEADE